MEHQSNLAMPILDLIMAFGQIAHTLEAFTMSTSSSARDIDEASIVNISLTGHTCLNCLPNNVHS